MADLFGATAAFEPAESFEEWMRRYIDRIARRAKMDRSAAEECVKAEADEAFYRQLFDDDELPEYAADEELSNRQE